MSAEVEREIQAYVNIQSQVADKIVYEEGLTLFCTSGVMPPNNRVTRCLGSVVKTLRARTVLDLGCGTGILALLVSHCADEVVGVDIDLRAIACARYNARLNGVKNVCFRLGDGYLPVGRRKFDCIISNPPFYPLVGIACPPASMCVNPEHALLYTLIQEAGQHLYPGGQVLFVTSSLSDNDRVAALLKNSGLDFCRHLLNCGRGISQDIYLWTARALL